jgi:ParB family chromosome partitioning protein
MTALSTIPAIPLNKLVLFKGNVRKTQDEGFIERLADSIHKHELQQNLIVIPQGKRFAVVGGGQRLKALQLLAKRGDIAPNYPVPCKITEGALDARELSLAENLMRSDMHPADIFEAIRDLVDDDVPLVDIAARFRLSEDYIRQLLTLARVSPVILAAYREGSLTLEQTKAFAVTDDRAAQESLLERFATLQPWQQTARYIRDALTEHEIPASDCRVKCVTLEAYEAAGGRTRKDWFTEGEDGIFILDRALLARLLTDKLNTAAETVAQEGWKWVQVVVEFDYAHKGQFKRIHASPAPLPEELAAEYAALERELETVRDQWHEADDDSDEPPRIGEIEQRLEAIDAERGDDVWTPEQLAMAGAVVTIDDDGEVEVIGGLVRQEDMPKRDTAPKKPDAAYTTGENAPLPSGLSAALIESLTAHRSAAIAAELRQRPAVALAVVVHAMASRIFRLGATDTALQVMPSPQPLQQVEGSKAFLEIEAARETWEKKLPDTSDGLWKWCLEQPQDVLLDLLAFCASVSINAVQGKSDRADSSRLKNADRLAAALNLDMKPWFTPDAENYFSRVSKPQILDALREGRSQPPAPAWEKMKKGELATLAARELAGSGWLPPLLRPAA